VDVCVIRNPKYGEEAKQELIEASGNSSIHLHILDMSLPRAVYAFTQGHSVKRIAMRIRIFSAGFRFGSVIA